MGGAVPVIDLGDDGKLVQAHVPPTPYRGNTKKCAISVEQYNPIQKPIIIDDDDEKLQEIKKPPRSVKVKSARTSYEASLLIGSHNIVRDIEKRISEITSIPIENGESLHVLRYEVGQKFEPHFDYSDPCNDKGGPWQATFLIYISDVEEGGETVFPEGIPKYSSSIQCGKGITVKPKMGDALLFWSTKPDGTRDPASLHSGRPILEGTKWSCTKLFHVNKQS